jgi:hypothetical protein
MGGGGWSGGRGGEFRGGDHGDHGDHGNHGDHGRHNNNNNNTTNNYNVTGYGGGWDGGWGWGAADDAIAGVVVGAAIGAAASSGPSTVVVEQPSTTVAQQAAPASPAYGTQVTTLPGGCTAQNVHGTMAYQCGSVWYRPYFGASGVYYEVVSPPPAEGSVSMGQGQ